MSGCRLGSFGGLKPDSEPDPDPGLHVVVGQYSDPNPVLLGQYPDPVVLGQYPDPAVLVQYPDPVVEPVGCGR